jgi:iron complex transport system ATP-binding protein
MPRPDRSTHLRDQDILAPSPTTEESKDFIEASNLSFSYKEFALNSISFQVPLGQFTTILGCNGSGKSTLLKLMSGYLKPETGTFALRGQNIHQMSLQQRARQIALVAQESQLNFSMMVREFVLMGRHPHLSWFKFEDQQSLEILGWALEMTDSRSLAHRNIQELSGGEKQRVILARALVQEPQLMLLDEPTMHLDVGYQVELVHLIKCLSLNKGFTVAMVTHELNIAAEFSDQVLLLHEGQALAFGPPENVLDEANLTRVFRTDLLVDRNPISGAPRITPVGRGKR